MEKRVQLSEIWIFRRILTILWVNGIKKEDAYVLIGSDRKILGTYVRTEL